MPSLALIFEVLANPNFCLQNITRQEILPKISAVNLKLSIKWVEFLENHARNLLLDSPGENSPSALLAEKILQKFRNGKWQDGATERKVRHLFRAKTDGQYWDDAIELLKEFGWIYLEKSTPKSGGTESRVIYVNPILKNHGTNGTTDGSNGRKSVKNTDISSSFDNYIPTTQNGTTDGSNGTTVGSKSKGEVINTVDDRHLLQNGTTEGSNGTTVGEDGSTEGSKNREEVIDTGDNTFLAQNGTNAPKNGTNDGENGEQMAHKAALIEGLRGIWQSAQISGVQDTLDALDQLSLGDAIWHDMVKYLAKVGDGVSKKGLLNFVAGWIGLSGDDVWWDS
ncbi:hypothetical protein THIOM_004232 [Candidatus Thiomargarita nelsonii]|uniref:Uncharacterized protein n=1 Tax=Candidatus Thiomargarita nelsonii TaxID=1003181 RepID=A0A176RWI3_9GAMM|nr:hypothetical protein THIOM_004232 [Candidatus Thiomargarita nelsonii]